MKSFIVIVMLSVHIALAASTQRPGRGEEEPSPFLDIASSFLESFSQGQGNGGGGGGGLDGIAGIASMIGNMVQSSDGGKSQGGGLEGIAGIASMIGSMVQSGSDGEKSQPSGAAQLIAGLGSLLAANSGGGGGRAAGGFDPSIIGNVISMFANANSNNGDNRQKRSSEGNGMETMLNLASSFLSNMNQNQDADDVETNEIRQEKRNPYKEEPKHPGLNGDAMLNLLPIVMQTLSSFSGSEMEKTEQKHKDHGGILPPFLEKIHTAWDHFTHSELSEALYKKIGLDNVFKGFVGRDGKVDYDQLFESLQNQSFRRRWIQKAIMYLADWANYIANPEVYQR
jgi:hypothetical protein